MNSFFKNKSNIILTILLCVVLGACGFLGYRFYLSTKKTIVPDFTDKTENDVTDWCNTFETNPCTITYDYSDTIVEKGIIYQSIVADSELTGDISFIISKGKQVTIEVPDLSNATKDTISEWANQNNILNITYVEDYSDTIAENNVIKIEPSSDITNDTNVTVTISKGKNPTSSDGTIVVNSGEYNNLTIKQFESKMAEIGLTPEHTAKKDEYSSTVQEGNIIWHGSGTYIKDEVIHYGVSLGTNQNSIVLTSGQYVDKTYSEFETAIKALGLVPYHRTEWDVITTDSSKVDTIAKNGYGTYSKGENCSYGLYVKSNDTSIKITSGQYKDKTYSEFETAIKALGLVPYHRTEWDETTTDSSKVGNICSHGSGTYSKGENCSYGLYVKAEDTSITISLGQYVGKTYSEFETAIKALGLVPYHRTEWDVTTTDSSKVNTISKNGSGSYSKGENCSYGLYVNTESSSSTAITITQGYYIGYSESDYISAIKALGLVPTHNSSWDAYSDTVEKGKIIQNGYGSYVKGETNRYGLSLGKKETISTTTINANAYLGKTESEFKSAISGLGLVANHDTSKDAYGNSVSSGSVIWHGSGSFTAGSTVYYGLSLGTKQVSVLSFNDMSNFEASSYTETETKVRNYYEKLGFASSNINISGQSSSKTPGIILSITINGSSLTSAASYPVSASIEVVISNSQDS